MLFNDEIDQANTVQTTKITFTYLILGYGIFLCIYCLPIMLHFNDTYLHFISYNLQYNSSEAHQ